MSTSNDIDSATHAGRPGYFAPFGWEHWPDFPMWSYQFRRGLGETQEGGGAVSESFQAASRMTPGDDESWYREFTRIADRNLTRGDAEAALGHLQTARNCWLRAADYYRQAEFWLHGADPRRLTTFDKGELCTTQFLQQLKPRGEVVDIDYEPGKPLRGYFIRSPNASGNQPVLISFGGLDSHKDELWFMTGRGALQRGMSVLLVDGPGQGGSLRRHGLRARHDFEVALGRCIDYLETRQDVELSRVAVSGSSLGGYYASRAACREPRIAACISHGAIWDLSGVLASWSHDHPLVRHFLWVFGESNMAAVIERAKAFDLSEVLSGMRCPYLIVHGGHDVLGVVAAGKLYEAAKAAGADVTLRIVTEEETGADHCQHDNPTLGQELMLDWLCDRFDIDQRSLDTNLR